MLDEADRQDIIERYISRLKVFGYSPETLGWGQYGRQEVRFSVLTREVLLHPNCSVLDVGCGFADLYDFLIDHGWHGKYTGIDIVPGLLNMAKHRHPGLDLRELDITAEGPSIEKHDFAISSGVLNARLKVGDNQTYIVNVLGAMYRCVMTAISIDFLSTYVDFQKPGSWHTDPAWALTAAMKLSRRVALRHDYMPFEFALLIFKDDSVSERNVFQEYEKMLSRE